MADPIIRDNIEWESDMAAVSMAGIRPITQGSVDVSSGSEGTYTIDDIRTKRAVIIHVSSGNTDVRFELNATAQADDFPLIPAVYFVVEVEEDDVLHFYNTTGGSVTVYILEIR